MNPIASAILWMSVQIALFSVVGFLALVLLRRRGPNAAAACCATVLGLTLPLAVMVVCPWPRWSIGAAAKPPVSDRGLNNGGSGANVTAVGGKRTDPTAEDSAAADAPPSSLAIWWQAAADWFRADGEQQGADVSTRSTWQTYLPWLIAAGIGVCLVRLVAGVWGVNCLRRNSRGVDDERLRAMLSEIVGTLDGIQSPANPFTRSPAQHDRPTRSGYVPEVRETAALRSAATIGWRRPVLLLPSDWRSWTETERRVVLAHELAHVARRDYLAAVIARVATSIHFYQPLVLWLSRQLRIQQELAADSHAAAIAGGRQTYLTTLAQMALRADDQPLPWAARAFLPGTSMLIKRVAWLKQKGDQKEMTMNQKTRGILVVFMAATAMLVAGIRGPNDFGSPLALAQTKDAKPVVAQDAPQVWESASSFDRKLRSAQYIPADAKFFVAFSPNALTKALGAINPILGQIGLEKTFGLPVTDLEDAEFIAIDPVRKFGRVGAALVTRTALPPEPEFDRVVLRAAKPFDWKHTLAEKIPPMKAMKLGAAEYFVMDVANLSRTGNIGPAFYLPDDRTLIAGTEDEIKKIIDAENKLGDFPFATPVVRNSQFVAWMDMSLAKPLSAGIDRQVALLLGPIINDTKSATISANLLSEMGKDQAAIVLSIECNSDEKANGVKATLEAGRTLLKNFLSGELASANKEIETLPPEQRALGNLKLELARQVNSGVQALNIGVDRTQVRATAKFEFPSTVKTMLIEPFLDAAREAAMRMQGMTNLKRIGLALHSYAAAYEHFPPAVIRDKAGKPLLSWRVAILPFLQDENIDMAGVQALYGQFHLDEPWDSEHNKALIAKMPAAYRDPHEDATSTGASYFMPTGPGTIGEKPQGTQFKEITDGTSKTIMLIEAKRDIPWTKPEDIEIDSDATKPLPKFGGHLANGLFGVAFADGSVHVFSQSVVDANILRDLFTIAGGEVVDVNVLEATAPPQVAAPADRNFNLTKSAIARILILDKACQLFESHVGRMPKDLNELIEAPKDPAAAQKWLGPYIDKLPPDPWGNPYHLQGDGTQKPRIWSSGPDGKDGTPDDITLDAVQK